MSITRRPDSIIKEAIKKREPELLHSNEITQCDNETLSIILKSIFLNKPTDAYWIISNLPDLASRIKFTLNLFQVALTQMHTFDIAENTAMYHCLTQMKIDFEEYELVTMSSFLEKNMIQIKADNEKKGYAYRVYDPENEFQQGFIPWSTLSMDYIPVEDEEILANKDKLLPEILKLTSAKGHTNHAYYYKIIDEYIHADSPHAISLALHLGLRRKKPLSLLINILPDILLYDSFHCLEQLLNHPNFNQELNSKFASKENVDDYPIEILKNAIQAQAPKSISTILKLKLFKPKSERIAEIIENLIKESAEDANLGIVLALCENDINKATHYLLKDSLFPDTFPPSTTYNPSNLSDCLLTMLRFAPIEIVDDIVNTYINSTHAETNKKFLQQKYSEQKDIFFKYAPNCSRYTKPGAFRTIKKFYNHDIGRNLIEKTKNDMEYGKERYELVKNLVDEMKLAMEGKPVQPTKKDLQNLPASSHGSKIFTALLEKIIDYHAKKHKNDRFSQLRRHGAQTSVAGLYDWAKPLVSAVYHHSESEQIFKYSDLGSGNFYWLTYKNSKSPITDLNIKHPVNEDTYWHHGRMPLENTIKDIEDLMYNLMKSFSDPGSKTDQTQLTEFYVNAARLVWLIGNTQPLRRGSGTVAELLLNAVFVFHDLQPPLLKTTFPHLDVLDITFPVDDYCNKLFPYFFEPSSLPQHMQKPSFSDLSTYEQIELIYNKNTGANLEMKGTDRPSETSIETRLETKDMPSPASLGVFGQPPLSKVEPNNIDPKPSLEESEPNKSKSDSDNRNQPFGKH